jgi:hypothetical protein
MAATIQDKRAAALERRAQRLQAQIDYLDSQLRRLGVTPTVMLDTPVLECARFFPQHQGSFLPHVVALVVPTGGCKLMIVEDCRATDIGCSDQFDSSVSVFPTVLVRLFQPMLPVYETADALIKSVTTRVMTQSRNNVVTLTLNRLPTVQEMFVIPPNPVDIEETYEQLWSFIDSQGPATPTVFFLMTLCLVVEKAKEDQIKAVAEWAIRCGRIGVGGSPVINIMDCDLLAAFFIGDAPFHHLTVLRGTVHLNLAERAKIHASRLAAGFPSYLPLLSCAFEHLFQFRPRRHEFILIKGQAIVFDPATLGRVALAHEAKQAATEMWTLVKTLQPVVEEAIFARDTDVLRLLTPVCGRPGLAAFPCLENLYVAARENKLGMTLPELLARAGRPLDPARPIPICLVDLVGRSGHCVCERDATLCYLHTNRPPHLTHRPRYLLGILAHRTNTQPTAIASLFEALPRAALAEIAHGAAKGYSGSAFRCDKVAESLLCNQCTYGNVLDVIKEQS